MELEKIQGMNIPVGAPIKVEIIRKRNISYPISGMKHVESPDEYIGYFAGCYLSFGKHPHVPKEHRLILSSSKSSAHSIKRNYDIRFSNISNESAQIELEDIENITEINSFQQIIFNKC